MGAPGAANIKKKEKKNWNCEIVLLILRHNLLSVITKFKILNSILQSIE